MVLVFAPARIILVGVALCSFPASQITLQAASFYFLCVCSELERFSFCSIKEATWPLYPVNLFSPVSLHHSSLIYFFRAVHLFFITVYFAGSLLGKCLATVLHAFSGHAAMDSQSFSPFPETGGSKSSNFMQPSVGYSPG